MVLSSEKPQVLELPRPFFSSSEKGYALGAEQRSGLHLRRVPLGHVGDRVAVEDTAVGICNFDPSCRQVNRGDHGQRTRQHRGFRQLGGREGWRGSGARAGDGCREYGGQADAANGFRRGLQQQIRAQSNRGGVPPDACAARGRGGGRNERAAGPPAVGEVTQKRSSPHWGGGGYCRDGAGKDTGGAEGGSGRRGERRCNVRGREKGRRGVVAVDTWGEAISRVWNSVGGGGSSERSGDIEGAADIGGQV